MQDGLGIRLGEKSGDPCRRLRVMHGQDGADDRAVTDPTSVDGLGQTLGWVGGVSAEGLEAGHEDGSHAPSLPYRPSAALHQR